MSKTSENLLLMIVVILVLLIGMTLFYFEAKHIAEKHIKPMAEKVVQI